jgi:aminopeptidase N
VGRAAPLFVYPNHDDQGYALITLDPVSLAFALGRLPDLPGPLLRQQVWSTLWEMVRDATLLSVDYLAAVRRFAPGETDRALLQSVLERASEVLRRFVPEARIDAETSAFVTSAMHALRDKEDDLRLTWARAACAAAGRQDIGSLLAFIDDGSHSDGLGSDQDMRWTLAIKVSAFALDGAEVRLEAERRRDLSDRGQRALLRAAASRPDSGAKAETWARINGHGFGSDYLTRAAISGFQWRHQRALLAPFRDPFYAHLEEVYATRDHAYARAYLRWSPTPGGAG